MKDFEDFRNFIKENGNTIDSEIESIIKPIVDDSKNLYIESKAYTQIAILKILEKYHQWLNS